MRIWEVDDSKAMPSDLVLEQDFILRVRRMQRADTPYLVLNFVLNAIDQVAQSRSGLQNVQKELQDFAHITNGVYCEMSNGDVFIIWEETSDAQILSQRIVDTILPGHGANVAQFLLTYHMPRDYAPLRERANHYVEVVRAASSMAAGEAADRISNAQGPMTAHNLDQIGQLLGEIDLRRYGRTQTIYRLDGEDWHALGEEYFVSFEDLRRERFPRLEVVTSEHFFFALCSMLDQNLLGMLTAHYDIIAGRRINLNLSIASIMGSVFAQFAHRVPHDQRNLLGFELHRGDLLQDFALTLSTIETLRNSGFRVALDSVTPDMAPYIHLDSFAVDAIKINVSKDRVFQLSDPLISSALRKLPPEKLVFFRCDNERALAVGRDWGVKKFQGWLIDDRAGGKKV